MDLECTCATCARKCGETRPSNCCSRWMDAEGRSIEGAALAALWRNDQKRARNWTDYVQNHGAETILT